MLKYFAGRWLLRKGEHVVIAMTLFCMTLSIFQTPQEFPLFDWVNQSNPKIVAVNFGYRLNIMGFLSSSALLAEGSSNGGILDQRAALDWVQRHISKFGGNPDEVTIDGESAGAASVVMQVVAFGGVPDSSITVRIK